MATDPFTYWLYFLAFLALYNTCVCYTPYAPTQQIWNLAADQVNPLVNRMFGTWTLIIGFIRLYAALNVDSKGAQMAVLITLLGADWFWLTERFIFGSTNSGSAMFSIALDVGSASYMIWRMMS